LCLCACVLLCLFNQQTQLNQRNMASLQIILFIAVFMIMALSMFFRKIPALIALPIMAFLIPLIGGVSLTETIEYVIGLGAVKLHTAYTVALFGSMLSILLQKTGVAENFIKKGAELAGDNPAVIGIIMLLLITILFTTLGGLGAIIMVATIVLPIMSSVGIGSMTIVGIFLIGLSMGGILNAGNWAVYVDVMGLSINEIRPFALTMFLLTFIASILYIFIQLYRDGHMLKFSRLAYISGGLLIICIIIMTGYNQADETILVSIRQTLAEIGTVLKLLIAGLIVLLFLLSFYRKVLRRKSDPGGIYWTAYFTPLIPLLLILILSMNFIAAFICGLVYGFVSTYRTGSLNTFVQSVLEGGAVVMPAVVLMLGIGMLLNAVIGPGEAWLAVHSEGWPVLNLLRPVIQAVVPENIFSYVLIFGLAAPLALYRGPLNVWGMGYGMAAVLLASGMSAGAVMGLLLAVGQVQGISDPTNTHNVWLANEMRQDVQKVLWNTLPYTWMLAVAGLIAAGLFFML